MDRLEYCYTCTQNKEKLRNCERLLSMTNEEKNVAIEMYQAGVENMVQREEVQCSENKMRFDWYRKKIQEKHIEMQREYSDAITMLQEKLGVLNSELAFQKKSNSQKDDKIMELQKNIEEIELSQETHESQAAREIALHEHCLVLEKKCVEYETMLERLKPSEVLEKEVEQLKKEIEIKEKQLKETDKLLKKTQFTAEHLVEEENEARAKVSEAISVVESALLEKRQAENQLVLSENECKRLQKELIDLINEAGQKVQKEVEAVKKTYEEQLNSICAQLSFLEKDRTKKLDLLEQQQTEIIKLVDEIEDVKRKSIPQRKFCAVSEQLVVAEAQVLQLQTENKSLHEVIMQNQHRYESELSKMSVERKFFQKQIETLQNNLIETGQNLGSTVDQCNQLTDHLNKLNSELLNQADSNQITTSQLFKQLQVTKIHSNTAMEELKRFVNAHGVLSSKWKDEYKSLTFKFKERLKELKSENKFEKRMNKKLLKKLSSKRSQWGNYVNYDNDGEQEESEILCQQFEN